MNLEWIASQPMSVNSVCAEHRRALLSATLIALFIGNASAEFKSDTQKPVLVASPDGRIRLELFAAEHRRLGYRITFKSNPVIETSPIAIMIDGVDLSQNIKFGKTERYKINEKYPWRGGHSQAVNRCNAMKLSVETTTQPPYTLDIRAFNDGAAFRYIIPANGKDRVPDEATVFAVPSGSILWYHDLNGHYEGAHQRRELSEARVGEWAAPPLTFKLPESRGYASITEAALVDFSGMVLQADGNGSFQLVLGHKHPISHPFQIRYSNAVQRVSQPASLAGTIVSPWRVIMVGPDLNALVNSDIVPNLSSPPDPKIFPKGINTSWLKPGRAVWKYLDGGENSFQGAKEFSRLAGDLGFEYNVIEGYWSKWSEGQIKELVDYARQRGVGLWFWKHSKDLRTAETRTEFFKKLHDWGVVGAKIDFFDHEQKEIIDRYQALLAESAKYQVMVNFHGANKPTGESRSWPNEMVREAVKGMESSKFQNRARHNTTLPFTRFLAGHADYTPVHFGARRADTTWAHQVATAVVFTAPLLTYGAHPTNILNNPALEMIKSIPPVWDETIVLPISEIGEVAAFARRRGETWHLAILNGPEPREIKVPLSFLGGGQYHALLVGDIKDRPNAVDTTNRITRRKELLDVELAPGGGFIARFSRN